MFFLMIRRPPRSTLDRSSAASDVYKRQPQTLVLRYTRLEPKERRNPQVADDYGRWFSARLKLSLIHISEPTRPY